MSTPFDRAAWLKVYRSFDPLTPAGSPDHPEAERVDRPYSPLRVILDRFAFPAGFQRRLVVGAPGSGKTTELLALMRACADRGDVRPIFIDLGAHFETTRGDAAALDHLEPWEVLVVVGLGLYRYGIEQLGHRWSPDLQRQLTKAIMEPTGAPEASVDVGALAGEVAVVGIEAVVPGAGAALKLLKAATAAVSANVPLGVPRSDDTRLRDQDTRVQALLHAVQRLVQELSEAVHSPLLLLIDGVDRGKAQLARRLFEESVLLASLGCHQVLTANWSVRVRNLRGWTPDPLGNVPVLDPDDPMVPAAQVAFFEDVWAHRAAGAGVRADAVPAELIRTLGWASGGTVRLFCELVQHLASVVWLAQRPPERSDVDAMLDQWRRRWQDGLTASEIKTLLAVRDRRLLSGGGPYAEYEQSLLDQRCIVAWPNGNLWHYPHPLLLLNGYLEDQPA